MTREELDLLVELIDAKIAEAGPQNGSDGGLVDAIRVIRILAQLRELVASSEGDES